MPDLPPVTMKWLSSHHGVVTWSVLKEHKVRRSTVTRLAAGGVLRRMSPGVFVDRGTPTSLEQRCAILCATHPTGFVTGPTAGAMAGLRRMPTTSALHFSIRHGIHIADEPGVRWRQTTAIATADRRVRADGIVVASWVRLAFDLAADLAELDHVSVLHQLLDEGKVTVEELAAIERRLGHPARPGSGVFRRALLAVEGHEPQDSHPEVVLADALRRLGVPVVHQAAVIADGRTFHIDLAVPDARWGVELDIHPEHRSIEGHAADAERRRRLHRQSWQIEVVTEQDMQRPARLADDLAELYRLRARAPSTA